MITSMKHFRYKGRYDAGGYKPAFTMHQNFDTNEVTIVDQLHGPPFRMVVKLPTLDGPTNDEIEIPASDIQCDHPAKQNLECYGRFSIMEGVWSLRVDSSDDDFSAFYVEVIGTEMLPPGLPIYDTSAVRSGSYMPRGRTGSSV